jgi:hypothetical protein
MPEGKFKSFVGSSKEDILCIIRDSSLTCITDREIEGIMKLSIDYIAAVQLRGPMINEISRLRFSKDDNDHLLKISNLENKIQIIDRQINLITENHYSQYRHQEGSKKWFKSFHLYHDNDFFLLPNFTNADRDYTGGFRFELTTDQLKIRLFKWFGNSEKFLSYQSLFIGGEGYTPYIRFTEQQLIERGVLYKIDPTTDYFTQESLDSIQQYFRRNQRSTDRPFASFQYIGRGKYRLHNSGLYRTESLFKLGKIGGSVGKNIQAVIHQDITTGSQRVLNWEDQIGSGGRLAFNIEHQIDYSVFSAERWAIWQNSENIKINKKLFNKIALNLNVYIPNELAIGTVQTHVGTGIGLSNKSFLETSGHNDIHGVKLNDLGIKLNKRGFWTKLWYNTHLDFKYRYRYIIHNSLLEGVGFYKPFQDDPEDDEATTVYRLEGQDVTRHLHRLSFQISFKLNKVTLYYKQERFINKEFSVSKTPEFNDFETSRWYGYGRIGLNFLM